MKQRKSRRERAIETPQAQKSAVNQFAEILKILSCGPAGDHASMACFLLNSTTRLKGRSPIQVVCKEDQKMLAIVKQLAIESSE